MPINCKNCDNPFGELKAKTLDINFKRVSNISYDFKEESFSLKCRNCSQYSKVGMDSNEIDYKKTGLKLLK